MRRADRERFDALLEQILAELPDHIVRLLDEAPLIVEDRPSRELLLELGMDPDLDDLCGLHTGTPLTDKSVSESSPLPETIHIFREGVFDQAGGWEESEDDEGNPVGGEEAVRREIRITLLHEIGHHFGLDEDDLARLGYE